MKTYRDYKNCTIERTFPSGWYVAIEIGQGQ